MRPEDVTPLLITLNEEANIARTLGALPWAKSIVVVDSGSTDTTLEILRGDSRVRVVSRPFDTFAAQCDFGLREAGIDSEWVLSLDADHVVSPELSAEIGLLEPEADLAGFAATFTYCVAGRPVRGSLYPQRIVLFRRSAGRFEDDGHGHRVVVQGVVTKLSSRILHDDRKPFSRWLAAQDRYAAAEAKKLATTAWQDLGWPDRIRRWRVVAPPLVLVYCLCVRGLVLDGWAGWHYSLQRAIAEAILSLRLIERDLGGA